MIVKEVCHAISLHPGPKYIKTPEIEEDVLKAVEEFEKKFGFTRCLGALDGIHVFIKDHQRIQLIKNDIERIPILPFFKHKEVREQSNNH